MSLELAQVHFEHPEDIYMAARPAGSGIHFLEVPAHRYFMIDGHGAPDGAPFRDAFEVLYPVAYTLHFALRPSGRSARVGALEGLFWTQPGQPLPAPNAAGTPLVQPQDWSWRLLLPVPPLATDQEIHVAIADVRTKKAPRAIDLLRVEDFAEGLAAQVLHIGPYDAEQPTIARLREAIQAAGLRERGCHHEIYISDPNRTAAAHLKTLIRQPVSL